MNVRHPKPICAFLLSMTMLVGCIDTKDQPSESRTVETSGDSSENTLGNTGGPAEDRSTPDETKSAGDGGALDSLPEDIFIAQGQLSAKLIEVKGSKSWMLEYPVGDLDSFVESFHNGMKEKEWTLVTASKLPIGTIANFSKPDRKCTVSIAPPKDQAIKVAIMVPSK